MSALDDIRAVCRSVSERPRPARIEVGSLAELVLAAVARPAEVRHGELGPLFGVPVVPSTELLPWQWRVLDADGAVLVEGEVGR